MISVALLYLHVILSQVLPIHLHQTGKRIDGHVNLLAGQVNLVRITSLVGNTYHARVHVQPSGRSQEMEFDVDSRPSDALNLALRFNAPIYVHKQLAAEMGSNAQLTDNLTSQEVIQSCREEMLCHHDPTVLLKLQLQIAIRSEQYVEAAR